MKMKILSHAYHRNGVAGVPFEIAIFEHEGQRMLGIWLSESVGRDLDGAPCFVVNLDVAAKGEIRFCHNSYRGDGYYADLLKATAEEEDEK